MSYVAIATEIKNILNTVTDLKKVYLYGSKELTTWPCAEVINTGHSSEFKDTAGNSRTYTFVIRIMHKLDEGQQQYETAELLMRQIVDAVVAALETNTKLNNSCDWAVPTEAKWGFNDDALTIRFCEITVRAKKRFVVR